MRDSKKYIIAIGVITGLVVGYFIADSLLFNGITPRAIQRDGFQANYFVNDNMEGKAAVILIGGGQWGDYWAQQFVSREMVGVSLPYIGSEGLPRLPEEIPLEYFENAINWLKKQPEVDPTKIVVMGASRNAELALVIASTFPESVHGVIAYAPSSVSWSNTVLPYNSDELKSSWTYNGADIPYVPMEKLEGNTSQTIELLDYWQYGLGKTDFVAQAAIKVEEINGPILLFSGTDDQVWPSSIMADMIGKRLEENNFEHSFQNIQYDNAGHLISNKPADTSSSRTGEMNINGKEYEYKYGGTDEGDYIAKQDAKTRLIEFLEKI